MTDSTDRLWTALSDRYAVEREIGHGGMATVYLARDLKHGRAVAIKVLRPDLAQAVGSERFLREIGIAAQLQSPHILPLLDSGAHDGMLFYVMPYVEGDSLRGRIAREGAIAPSEAMRLLRDIVDGVAHAHRKGVVHRDLKPDNVMIAERHALVVDFGVAKAMRDATAQHALTSIGISLGTPAYMSPEQAAADPNVDHRADIYALGVMAYEMLTGKTPFTGPPQAILAAQVTQPVPPLLTVRPDVPPAIAQLVMRCLEKDPGKRYQTADDLLLAIESLSTPAPALTGAFGGASEPPRARARRRLLVSAGIAAALLVIYAGTRQSRRERWVQGTALPELRRLTEAAEYDSAFTLALRIEEIAPKDTTLAKLMPRISRKSVIASDPPGARVYRTAFPDTTQWRLVGTTPTDSVRLPVRVGLYRYEKPGYRTVLRIHGSRPDKVYLDPMSAAHGEMVRIEGGELRAFLVGSDNAPPLVLGAYAMDRFEVSNRDYKKFVDAGGYRDRAFWTEQIRDGDKLMAFDAAMARFVDKTGRPGPATWEGGDFPSGQGDYPVGGVSWYEAAAYAKYAGKSLPTIYHWAHAATVNHSRFVVPFSNLAGKGPLAVGTPRGVTAGGLSDMAGNVREWQVNDAGGGLRYILGGGWSDQLYAFVHAYAQPPMDRQPINGIRLARLDSTDANLAASRGPVARAFTDYSKVTPVGDAVFAGYRRQFDYDPIALDAKVELRDTTPEDWNLERVSFTAAYGGERMLAWVYTPKRGKGPFQTVVYFPGSGVIFQRASAKAREDQFASFVVRSGRAWVLPIYKGTYERSDSLNTDIPSTSIFYRDHAVMWGKDYRRTLDYLGTRADIDTSKFAYFGVSWGGYWGGIIPAIEPRLKAAVLYVAGLTMERGRDEVEPVNYLPRIRIPVIMLNGKYDFFFPVKTAQEPFFSFLGTPAADKKYIVYEGGHDVPRTQLIKESLAWYDKYLGPVK